MKISFVVVNYNGSNFTQTFVTSVHKAMIDVESLIVVVDNNSDSQDKDILSEIRDSYSNVIILENDINVGYFSGINLGLDYLEQNKVTSDFVIIGNNDLIIPEKFVQQLKNIENRLLEYPVICPNLLDSKGTHQNPHAVDEITPLRICIWNLYYSYYWVAFLINLCSKNLSKWTKRNDEQKYQFSGEINEGYGACYILTPLFFKEFGRLFSPTFMNGEEFFLRVQLEKKGYKKYYESSITIIHNDHSTTSKMSSKEYWNMAKKAHETYIEVYKSFRKKME